MMIFVSTFSFLEIEDALYFLVSITEYRDEGVNYQPNLLFLDFSSCTYDAMR